jgi:membrane-bound lytic murein transglycosylase A
MPEDPDAAQARRFFEDRFEPHDVIPPGGRGFLTGYYEPEFPGSREPTPAFRVPLLARPEDLVTVPQGETLPGLDPGLQAGRRTAEGLRPYPDRAAIEEGALGPLARPVVYLREPGEAFIIHVQGSARIRLADGSAMRVAYAGRNGHPYTSIGRILVERGAIPLAEMSLERLMGWLRDHPGPARDLMRTNRSYIFFREATELAPEDGPIGGAGVPLAPGRSLAVDRSLWSYGLPVWLEGALPLSLDRTEPLRRLMVAQDTGSAIVGPARGDFFFGSGAAAGTRAGLLRHPVRVVVLLPKAPR